MYAIVLSWIVIVQILVVTDHANACAGHLALGKVLSTLVSILFHHKQLWKGVRTEHRIRFLMVSRYLSPLATRIMYTKVLDLWL